MYLLVLYVSGVNGVSPALVRIVEMCLLVLYVCRCKRCEPCNGVSPALVRIVEMCIYWFCMFVGVNGVSPALVRIVEMCIYWFCMFQV